MPATEQDPFIGRIVKNVEWVWFILDKYKVYNSTSSIVPSFEYEKGSLFLVVGIKNKDVSGKQSDHYILKPLNDNENNPSKDLVWHFGVFSVETAITMRSMEIVE